MDHGLFSRPDLFHDVDVIFDPVVRLPPRLPVPAFDNLWSGYANAADGAVSASQLVEGCNGHRGVRRGTAGELNDSGTKPDPLGVRCKIGKRRDCVGAVGLCRPDRVVAQLFCQLHKFDGNVQFRTGISEHQTEFHWLPPQGVAGTAIVSGLSLLQHSRGVHRDLDAFTGI